MKWIVGLVGGGGIFYEEFGKGGAWYTVANASSNERVFSPELMADNLFGNCPNGDVCVNRPTLHDFKEQEEAAFLNSSAFTTSLKELLLATAVASDRNGGSAGEGNGDFSIALSPSVEHFHSTGASLLPPDSFTPGAQLSSAAQSGCMASMRAPPREVALTHLLFSTANFESNLPTSSAPRLVCPWSHRCTCSHSRLLGRALRWRCRFY
mmetsp:Transcript_15635/g.31294  ORF Transcript_15635/g.31294 Transcript_15635/m.31294 type:complete len:209 (+) Transcript_15635:171-797(+)